MKSLLFLATVLFALPAQPVVFEWDHSPDPLVTSYRLYWGTNTGTYTASRVTANRTNALVVDDKSLAPNTPYFFAVTAVNAAGIESVPSNEVGYTNVVKPAGPTKLRVVVDITPGTGGTATATTTISTVVP